MSSQTKLIKDILSIYDTILENMKMDEAVDSYDNVDFKDNVVGNSTPSKDNINTALLQDIQTAAQNAGVKVDITTAVTGHRKGSRHDTGNAIDIAIINGKAVSLSNRGDADKLVAELVKMGYTKNSESGNPKAVLTFGFKGHDNHIHVSNTTSTPVNSISNNTTGTTEPSDTESTTGTTTDSGEFAKTVGKALLQGIGITEEKVYSSFGNNYEIRYGEVIIPKDNNKKIKSPVSGVVTSYSYKNDCKNQLVIKFEINGSIFYLEYCGLESHSVRVGESVEKGNLIGVTDSDVRIILYDSMGKRKHINPKTETTAKNKNTNTNDYSKNDESMFTTAYKTVKDSWFKKDDESKKKDDNNDDNKDTKISPNDSMFTAAYKSAKNSLFKKDKLKEDIERIKGLL